MQTVGPANEPNDGSTFADNLKCYKGLRWVLTYGT